MYIHWSSTFRLEEKVSDMEAAEQILRKRALVNAPSGRQSGRLVPTTPSAENGHHVSELYQLMFIFYTLLKNK